MRITIITQNEPFYLAKNLSYLLENLSNGTNVVSCVITKASPFGKKKGFIEKVLDSYQIFGFQFFIYYSFKYFYSIFFQKSVISELKHYGVKVIELQGNINSDKNVNLIKQDKPDLLISILGNQIFKKQIFDLAPKGCLNLHTALLPKYRGLMPTFWVLKNQEQKTGVSVFLVDEGIDSGPIVVQKECIINNKSQAELIKETKILGMQAIIEAIEKIQQDTFDLIPNPKEEATYFSFPTREDVKQFKSVGKKFF